MCKCFGYSVSARQTLCGITQDERIRPSISFRRLQHHLWAIVSAQSLRLFWIAIPWSCFFFSHDTGILGILLSSLNFSCVIMAGNGGCFSDQIGFVHSPEEEHLLPTAGFCISFPNLLSGVIPPTFSRGFVIHVIFWSTGPVFSIFMHQSQPWKLK